jgi:hypothetical protein
MPLLITSNTDKVTIDDSPVCTAITHSIPENEPTTFDSPESGVSKNFGFLKHLTIAMTLGLAVGFAYKVTETFCAWR